MMKKSLLVLFFTFCLLVKMAEGETFTANFITLGNCSICKSRIENAVNQLSGIQSVSWNISADVTTVTYYTDTTDVYNIMHAIANVGHDTEWFRAPDSAYNLLIGTCCEYDRTIDYNNVQVGYLSLMDIWMFPLGIDRNSESSLKFLLYPNPASNLLSVKAGPTDSKQYTATISSMQGKTFCSETFTGEARIDISRLSPGEYILTLTSDGILFDKKKFIRMK